MHIEYCFLLCPFKDNRDVELPPSKSFLWIMLKSRFWERCWLGALYVMKCRYEERQLQ